MALTVHSCKPRLPARPAAQRCFARLRTVVRAQALPSSTPSIPGSTYSPNGANGAYTSPPVVVTNVQPPPPGLLSPADTYKALAKAGGNRANLSTAKTLVSAFLAGCFISFGACLAVSVQGGLAGLTATLPGLVKLIGATIFPVGLLLVITSGAELYTGNTAFMSVAKLEKTSSMKGLLHNWAWSYVGNLLGSLTMVAAIYATGCLVGNPVPVGIAEAKAGLPWLTAFVRALLCNWLVCMALWNATAASTLPGKIMGIWPPIVTFVAIGLEHSVANMFFIPMGIVMGAKVTWSQFFLNNLLPVTLGNTLAGVLLVALGLGFVHGSLGAEKTTQQQPASVPAVVAANN